MSKRAEGGTGKLVNRAYWLGFVAGFGFKTIFDSFMVRTLAERYKRALDRFTEKEIWRQANKVTHSHGQHGPHTHDDYVNHQQPIDNERIHNEYADRSNTAPDDPGGTERTV